MKKNIFLLCVITVTAFIFFINFYKNNFEKYALGSAEYEHTSCIVHEIAFQKCYAHDTNPKSRGQLYPSIERRERHISAVKKLPNFNQEQNKQNFNSMNDEYYPKNFLSEDIKNCKPALEFPYGRPYCLSRLGEK